MSRPNILWIQTDEQRPDSLGCYGSSWAKTPCIDSIAQRGVVFTNCVCNSPVCVPSRASQLTARYPQEISVLNNDVQGMDSIFPAHTVTFPEVFAKAGYATASFGKWHTPRHPTWDYNDSLVNLETYSGYYALAEVYDETSHHVIKRPGSTPIILAGTYPTAQGHPSQVITDRAIEWLRSVPADRPFLLRVSHNWPHTPVLAPPPFDTLYNADDLPVRYYDESVYRGRSFYDRQIADNHRMRELPREQMRQMWKDYMGLVACVDHETGRMLSALQELGLGDNTIILFSADHGKGLGEWGATEKGYFDSEVWRVPFILSGPGVTAGEASLEICELVDTARTLLDLAGLEAPEDYRGRNVLFGQRVEDVFGQIGWPSHDSEIYHRISQLSGPTSDIKNRDGRIWAEYCLRQSKLPRRPALMRAAIRSQQYRMDVNWWYEGRRVSIAEADGNLFDLEADPLELTNLWNNPESLPVIHDLWRRLQTWSDGMKDPT